MKEDYFHIQQTELHDCKILTARFYLSCFYLQFYDKNLFIHFYIVIDLICQETILKNKNSAGTMCQSDCKRQELDAPPLPQHLTIQIKPCFSLRNVCLLLLFNLYTTVNLPLSFNSFREETIIFLKKLVKEKRVNQITER